MNIRDVSNELFQWFSDNDSFCISKDFNKVILITEHRQRDTAALKAALNNLEKVNLIQKQEIEGEEIWVLEKPFEQYEQTVEIPPQTCIAITEIINSFCDEIEDQTDRVNSSEITPKDINNLVILCNHFKSLTLPSQNNEA
jgi:hypothetical protein|tara:strand:+ start:19212 stop:19634 length:423 start_codon:yes stop_codon:yes gene_type:complete